MWISKNLHKHFIYNFMFLFSDWDSISHYTISLLSYYKSCTFIFIFLLITHYVTEPMMVHGQTYHIITWQAIHSSTTWERTRKLCWYYTISFTTTQDINSNEHKYIHLHILAWESEWLATNNRLYIYIYLPEWIRCYC